MIDLTDNGDAGYEPGKKAGGSVVVAQPDLTPAEIMAMFDSLPKVVRDAFNVARVHFSIPELLHRYRSGTPATVIARDINEMSESIARALEEEEYGF